MSLSSDTLQTFAKWFQGLAASASESNVSGGGSDGARRGLAPAVETGADLVLPGSAVSRTALRSMWSTALSLLEELPQPLLKPPLAEVASVHPVVAAFLQAALPADKRLWRDVITPDSIDAQEMKPDFTVTDLRDRSASLLGAVLLVEVKLPDNLRGAIVQGSNFGRRRLFRLFQEADRRGDAHLLHSLSVLVACTDGVDICFVLIRTGAPPPGTSWRGLQPCLSFVTPAAPLLERSGAAAAASAQAPLGFAQLARVLAAPLDALNPTGAPLSCVHAELPWGSLELLLHQRLGSGGYSDAYSLLRAVPGAEGLGCVLKVARWASDKMAAQYKQEAEYLQALAAADAPHVPLLLAAGERSGGRRWPLLILSPCCRQLATALHACLAAADSQQSKREARFEFAGRVLSQTQEALRAAHALGIFHCDIRVDNVLADERGNVCLIDWGMARGRGASALNVGVPAFALGAQFDGTVTSCTACERVDLSAAALLWLCVAYGRDCRAPWPTAVAEESAAARRSAWLCERAARGDPLLSSLAARLTELEGARWRCCPDDYSWTPSRS